MKGKWIFDYIFHWPTYLRYQLRIAKQPYLVTFNLTNICNSRCIMCNFWKNKKRENEITPKEIKQILQQEVMKNITAVALTGGEILLRPDILEIIDIIYDTTGIKPHFGTNGLLPFKLDQLIAAKKDKIAGVMISVDGVGEIHESIRGKGTFDITMRSIKLLKEKYNLIPTINMTLCKENYLNLLETYTYFEDYPFTYKIAKKSKMHFGDNRKMDFELNEEQIKKVLEDTKQLSHKNMYDIFLGDWALYGKRPSPCYAGITQIVINHDCTVQPCIHKHVLGNTRQESLNDIWNSPSAKQFRKTHKNCQDCYERCTVETFGIDLPKWVIKAKLKEFKEH